MADNKTHSPNCEYSNAELALAAAPVVGKDELREALRIARIRLGICADRMRGCNEDGGKHELIAEVDNWVEEAAAALGGTEK
jgi:hypothetical protein